MRDKTAVVRTLKRAAQAVGGLDALAARLAVPLSEVERWIAGTPPPPGFRVFIEALDIVSLGRVRNRIDPAALRASTKLPRRPA